VENYNAKEGTVNDNANADNDDKIDSNTDSNSNIYQLLGRTWMIAEDPVSVADSASISTSLSTEEEDEDDESEVTVNAPTTGVVGHLPVIRPGEMFEYTSGCDLASATGTMKGCFHMAAVDRDTKSAQVGDMVDALHAPKDQRFKIQVAPFRLIANKENDEH
jgi:uncharacterized protein affecting Mg2+/Co2+ transport